MAYTTPLTWLPRPKKTNEFVDVKLLFKPHKTLMRLGIIAKLTFNFYRNTRYEETRNIL